MQCEKKRKNINWSPARTVFWSYFTLKMWQLYQKLILDLSFDSFYNLTAITFLMQGYCAIWTECMSGRVGNDIASAFMQILNKVAADHPNVTELICWSDSSVPQNRNSHISQAILEYLSKQSRINVVTMKYSLHQEIEVAMRVTEFYLHLPFWRLQGLSEFLEDATILQFHSVPYTKQKQPTEMFYIKRVLKNFIKFTEKHLRQSLFFNRVVDLRPVTLFKKRLWYRCFPVQFV